MLQYDFEESVGYWVCTAAHAMQRAVNEELAPHGITFRQFQILAWLALEGTLSQNDLAERMDIEPATLVSVLGRMERDGWIARDACATDRRKRMVRATAAAQPVWEKVAACARRVRARATRGFQPEQLQLLKEMLGTMRQNLAASELVEQSA